jgi:conjugative transfer signal peptidase TraF
VKRRFLAAAGLAGTLATLSAVAPLPPLLLWNASDSVPMGLWRVVPRSALDIDDVAVARLAPAARRLAVARGYLPSGVPVIKPVAAVEGDIVCADRTEVAINGRRVVDRLRYDSHGRPMPWWAGCVRIGEGEVFLLAGTRAGSFDGRYFGISRRDDLIGRATPLWVR